MKLNFICPCFGGVADAGTVGDDLKRPAYAGSLGVCGVELILSRTSSSPAIQI